MGCGGSKASAGAKQPGQPQGTAAGEVVARQGSQHMTSAKAFLNALIRTALPAVCRGVERLLIEANKTGGLPLGVDSLDKDPPYKLRVLKSGPEELQEGDILKKLNLEVRSLTAVETGDAVDVSKLPTHMKAGASEVLMLDIEVDAQVDFREAAPDENGNRNSKVEFQIHGEKWWSPTLGQIGIETLHADATLRVWWSLGLNMLAVAFLKEPILKWDIEVSLSAVGIPLPDGVEDTFVAWSLRKILSCFDADHPLEIPQGDMSKPPAPLLDMMSKMTPGAPAGNKSL